MIAASLAVLALVVGWRLVSPGSTQLQAPGRTTVNTRPDGVSAGHLFLRFQHGRLYSICDQTAQKLSFPMACPNLLPSDATIPGPGCCIFGDPNAAPIFALDSRFLATAGYPGADVVARERPTRGHFLMIEMRRTRQSSALACASTQALGGGPPVLGSASSWHFCPGSQGDNAHHLILAWETEGIDYSISLHGNTADNRLALELIALNLSINYPGDS